MNPIYDTELQLRLPNSWLNKHVVFAVIYTVREWEIETPSKSRTLSHAQTDDSCSAYIIYNYLRYQQYPEGST